jgi:hypothetical protein
MPGAVQDFLDSHLQDHVGMRADPGAARGNLAQQRIKRAAGSALMNRIDPHEYAVSQQQLLAHILRELFGIDRGLGANAERVELFEDAVEAIVVRRRGSAGLGIAAPENCDLVEL